MAPAHTLASHTTIGSQHQTLSGNVFERLSHEIGYLLWRFHLQRVVIDDADAYLLSFDAADGFEIHSAGTARLERDHVGVDAVESVDGRRVARLRVEQSLRAGVTPAGVTPDLGLTAQPSHGPVEYLDHEIGIEQVIRQAFGGEEMDLRLFDLDHFAAGFSKFGQFGVQHVRYRDDSFAQILVIKVTHGHGDQFGRNGPELHGLGGQPLCCLPERGVFEGSSSDRSDQIRHDARFQDVMQNVAAGMYEPGASSFFAIRVCAG